MNHEILLAKLHFNGIGRVGLPEEWFYLSNRRQNVEVKSPNTTINVSSVWGTLKHGANKVHFCMHQDFKHFTTFTDNP
jgi:deoxyribodipyrimidine photolyase